MCPKNQNKITILPRYICYNFRMYIFNNFETIMKRMQIIFKIPERDEILFVD